MRWQRIAGYGVVLWLAPFLVAFVLFGIRESNRALFESLITVIGVACAVAASLLFFRKVREVGLVLGLIVGFAWAAISIVIDLPIFLSIFHMPLPDYAADIALTYLSFPLITTGIAVASAPRERNRDVTRGNPVVAASATHRARVDNPDRDTLDWLAGGDVSIQYQIKRDLLGVDDRRLQARIATEGWGARLLGCRHAEGSWGRGFYQPKWTSSHYTLLDLKTLAIAPDSPFARESVHKIALEQKKADGGIGPGISLPVSDVCVNGMFLNYASYFGEPQSELRSIVDFLLDQHMKDGGFNCMSNRSGARHSSLHSTLSVLEGIHEYSANGYRYRRPELERAAAASREFILQHRLFKSDHTGAVIRQDFLRFVFPPRYKYNVLKALDYFRAAGRPWDERMRDALAILLSKRCPDGRWPLPTPHPGQVHFTMEKSGQPSRWNTLLALRVLKTYPALR